MKKIVIFILLLIGMLSCGNHKKSSQGPFFENELSFLFLKDNYDKSNKWIKQPTNIEMLHETFKEIGYVEILEHLNWTEEWTLQMDNRKSLKNLIDSLQINYQKNDAPKYYKEFWERRIKDGNDLIVYKVLSEIKSISVGERVNAKSSLVNDTLKYLGRIELKESLSNVEANEFLGKLIDFGLYHSAWNVRSGENSKFESIQWENDPINTFEKLKTTKQFMKPWIEDNTK